MKGNTMKRKWDEVRREIQDGLSVSLRLADRHGSDTTVYLAWYQYEGTNDGCHIKVCVDKDSQTVDSLEYAEGDASRGSETLGWQNSNGVKRLIQKVSALKRKAWAAS